MSEISQNTKRTEYYKQYYEQNKDKMRQASREYYDKHKTGRNVGRPKGSGVGSYKQKWIEQALRELGQATQPQQVN